MKTIKFIDFDEMAYDMMQYAESGKDVTAVLFYEDAGKLMKNLLVYDNVLPGWIELEDVNYNDYDREFYVSLLREEGKRFSLFVEKAYKSGLGSNQNKTDYLFCEGDIAYFLGDVHSSVISHVETKRSYEVEIAGRNEDDECEECDDETCPFSGSNKAENDNTAKKPIARRDDVLEIPLDISVDVEITTKNSDGKIEHLEDLESEILDVIDDILDQLFYDR